MSKFHRVRASAYNSGNAVVWMARAYWETADYTALRTLVVLINC